MLDLRALVFAESHHAGFGVESQVDRHGPLMTESVASGTAVGVAHMLDDVVVEYRGQAYNLPVLLVGSVRCKLSHGDLCDRLEEGMDGRREVVVVVEGEQARSFYSAARSISVSFERGNVEWRRLLVALQTHASHSGSSRSRILGDLPKRR